MSICAHFTGSSAVYSNVFNFPTQSAIASTNDTKILELSAYKEVIMLKNFIHALSWLLI